MPHRVGDSTRKSVDCLWGWAHPTPRSLVCSCVTNAPERFGTLCPVKHLVSPVNPVSGLLLLFASAFHVLENYWLVVSIPLKNISQLGWLFRIPGKIEKCSKPLTRLWPVDIHKTSEFQEDHGSNSFNGYSTAIRSGIRKLPGSPKRSFDGHIQEELDGVHDQAKIRKDSKLLRARWYHASGEGEIMWMYMLPANVSGKRLETP